LRNLSISIVPYIEFQDFHQYTIIAFAVTQATC
jgi:hypothetical protein